MKKRKKYLIFVFAILLCGIIMKMLKPIVRSQCLEIHARKDIFYGKLAANIEKELQRRGYIFSCPSYFPKTILDFTYTGDKYYQHQYPKQQKDVHIALVGDCFDAFDIDFLKTYDYILAVSEMSFGYLAMFNFKAIHFPIKETFTGDLCYKDYELQSINISDVANQLDDFIQRTRFDAR